MASSPMFLGEYNIPNDLFGVYYTTVGTGHFYVNYVKFNGADVSNVGNIGDASWSMPTPLAICNSQPYWPYQDAFGNTELRFLGSVAPMHYSNTTVYLTCSTNVSVLYAVTSDANGKFWFIKINTERKTVTTLLSLSKGSKAAIYDSATSTFYIAIDESLLAINVHSLEVKKIPLSGTNKRKFSGIWIHKNNTLVGVMRDPSEFGPIYIVQINPSLGTCKDLVKFSNTSDLLIGSIAFSQSDDAVYMMQGYDNQPGVGFYRLGIDGASKKVPLDPSHHPSSFAVITCTE